MAFLLALLIFFVVLVFAGPLLNATEPPSTTDGFRVDPKAFVFVFGLGFFIALMGHLGQSKLLVGTGIALIFLATLVVPLYFALSQ